ncbi:MAG: PQQ-binding-like beta-propeller repeat protein, partial [Candidatus Bathyarchaeota archaeon]|nr:PQQ-binding-like beta-propeller repeat protein [Candidatus Bathyarchaeota archaeon]
SSPAVADGKVYIGSWDDKVYCLNATTGAHIWNYTTGDWVNSSPAVADGRVFVGSYDNRVYAFEDPIYTLTITANNAGTTNPAPGTYTYYEGTTVVVYAIPNPDYVFDHWELDSVNVGSSYPYTVTMDADHTLHAVYLCTRALKVGIFGPMRLIQGVGMLEGAQIAKEYIGINLIKISGNLYDVELVPVDSALGESTPEPTGTSGALAMSWLLDQDVDLIYGGFRSEAVFPARELAMDEYKIWCICGAAPDELIDCGDGTCGACVRCDYDRYKYMFRNTPTNSTTLLKNMATFLQGYLVPKLAYLYGEPSPPCNGRVRCAVLAETTVWSSSLYWAFTTMPNVFLGPSGYMDVGVCALVAPDAGNVNTELSAMDTAGVRLIITILSGDVGRTFELAYAALGINAVPFGIDVVAQMSETWDLTGGACEYESFLASAGTRTPISTVSEPYNTTEFWDLYSTHWPVTVDGWTIFSTAHAPIYTAYGVYQSIIDMKNILETAGVVPPFNTKAKSDALVPYFEAVDSEGVLGKFKYTTYHDVYSPDTGPTWPSGYTRVHIVQWQAGQMEVVYPMDQLYTKRFKLPPVMYPLLVDLDLDAFVTIADVSAAASAFGAGPGHPRWNYVADVDDDWFITISDVSAIAVRFGDYIVVPITTFPPVIIT